MIVVDTREQDAFSLPCRTIRATLPSGDYSVLGHEHAIAVERKRPAELYGNFGAERERFEREYERLAGYDRAVVVIEGSMADILRQPRHSQLSPTVVVRSLASWFSRYGVPFIPAGGRAEAQALTYHILANYHRHKAREAREHTRDHAPEHSQESNGEKD